MAKNALLDMDLWKDQIGEIYKERKEVDGVRRKELFFGVLAWSCTTIGLAT